jgi:phosphatidylglycerophosphatase C
MQPAAQAWVVFDMDGTLMHGDCGAQLIRSLIRRHYWRRLLAILVAPLGFPLMAMLATRRVGVSLFFWIATFGLSDSEYERLLDDFVRRHPPLRIEPVIAALQEALDLGQPVAVATGAGQTLAERMVAGLQLRGQPLVIGSTIQPLAGGWVSRIQANGDNKLRRMAECGLHPPFAVAWSDSASDLPLLTSAREAHWVSTGSATPGRVLSRLPNLIVHRLGGPSPA